MRLSLSSFTAIAAVLAFTAASQASVIVKTPLSDTSATTHQTQTMPGVKSGIILQNNQHSTVGNNGIILQNNTHAGAPADVNGDGHETGTPNPNHQNDAAGNSNGGSAGPGGGPHTADTHAIVSPRDHASGLPTGKRMHKPLAKTTTHGGLGTHATTGTHGIIIEGHEAAGGGLGSHNGAVHQATGGDDGGGDGGNVASPRDPASQGIIIQGGLHGGLGSGGGTVSLGPKQDDPSPPPSTDSTATTAGGGSPGGSPTGNGGGHSSVDGITPNPSASMGQQSSH